MLFRVALLFLISVPILVGYLWMFISTFAVRTHGLMPVDAQGNFGGLTLANWVFLKDPVLWTALGNTFLLAAGLTVFTVLISSMAGYALARIQFRFRKQLLSLTLVLHAFPSVTLLIAIYFVLKGLSAAPILGPWIGYNTMGGVILVSVATYYLFHTRYGLRARSVGEHPRAADTLGINVYRTRYINVTLAGMVAGFGGAWFTLGSVGRFDENMTGGLGYIGLAAMIFGRWHPFGALIIAPIGSDFERADCCFHPDVVRAECARVE